jgi:hypothetical protein
MGFMIQILGGLAWVGMGWSALQSRRARCHRMDRRRLPGYYGRQPDYPRMIALTGGRGRPHRVDADCCNSGPARRDEASAVLLDDLRRDEVHGVPHDKS